MLGLVRPFQKNTPPIPKPLFPTQAEEKESQTQAVLAIKGRFISLERPKTKCGQIHLTTADCPKQDAIFAQK